MNSRKPIIILEDDADEHELFLEAFHNIGCQYPLKFFTDGEEFLRYLSTTPDNPLMIISAVNLYKMDGLEVRQHIQSNDALRQKGIPFIFLTVKDDRGIIKKAYDLTVQGYFVKGSTLHDLQTDLDLILTYWKKCRHPNM